MASCKGHPPNNEWFVSIPLSDLNKLRAEKEYLEKLEAEHTQLRREFEGLQGMFRELMTRFGELRRELKER